MAIRGSITETLTSIAPIHGVGGIAPLLETRLPGEVHTTRCSFRILTLTVIEGSPQREVNETLTIPAWIAIDTAI